MKLKNILQAVLLSAIVILSSCKKDKDATPGPLDCAGVEYGIAAADDCGVCHSSYMYDMITHQSTPVGTYADTVGMSGMFVLAGSTMDLAANPMWNASCYLFTDSEGASTVAYGGQTARLNMASELGSALSSNVTEAMLNDMFMNTNSPFADADLNASTKNIGGKTASAAEPTISASEQAAVITAIQGWFSTYANEVAPISGGNAVDNPASAGVPGFIDNRELDGKGLEYDQVVIKTLIGALCLDQVCNSYLSPTKLNVDNIDRTDGYTAMEHHWDEGFGYVYGKFGADNKHGDLSADGLLGKYVNKSGFEAEKTAIYNAFLAGRKAIVAMDYNERDAQAMIIKQNLSKVVAQKAIDYLEGAAEDVASLNADYFHGLSEGYGFIVSLQFTNNGNGVPYMTHQECMDMVAALEAGNGLWDRTAAELTDMATQVRAAAGL